MKGHPRLERASLATLGADASNAASSNPVKAGLALQGKAPPSWPPQPPRLAPPAPRIDGRSKTPPRRFTDGCDRLPIKVEFQPADFLAHEAIVPHDLIKSAGHLFSVQIVDSNGYSLDDTLDDRDGNLFDQLAATCASWPMSFPGWPATSTRHAGKVVKHELPHPTPPQATAATAPAHRSRHVAVCRGRQ